jgi:plastocyanin
MRYLGLLWFVRGCFQVCMFTSSGLLLSAGLALGDASVSGRVTLVQQNPKKPMEAVVYLEGNFGALPDRTYTLSQKDLEFEPRLLPITKGGTVEFPNLDDEYHNVFSYSRTKRFDLGRYKMGDTPATQKFEQAGTVKVYCEIHRHMRGTILVLDTPHFVKTDLEGNYKLDLAGVPDGKYLLKVWVDDKDIRSQEIELKGSGVITADFPAKTS